LHNIDHIYNVLLNMQTGSQCLYVFRHPLLIETNYLSFNMLVVGSISELTNRSL